ncbi:ABC transporter permease [Thermanaerothrix sp.]|jgi:putative ABC transport system permease protein|uniref:ABC transporter permease n=1 Tax=Thermanaerothrix sp. TaxID=2972675 RepID=UPI002ADE50E0|nr:ABC transporter permease [Thermanaerothrix sp.]
MIIEILKEAWRSLRANKLRSLLTTLGVIIGVAAVIVMMAISAGTEAAISESIYSLGSNLIFISSTFSRVGPGERPQNTGGLVYDDVAAIREKIKGVAGVTVDQQASVTVRRGDVTLDGVTLLGTTADYPVVRGLSIASGRYFTNTEVERAQKVAVLGKTIAEKLFGDEDPIGQAITVNKTQLTVIGVLAEKGLVAGTDFDQIIYTPIKVVFQKFTPSQFARFMGDRVRQITVAVEPNANIDQVVEQITLLLVNRHNVSADSPDFNIRTQADIIKARESTTATFRNLLIWVASVSLLVGGIGIMNIMLVSVTERTREIGLRQAVGATPEDIQIQFLTEALVLSLLGGIIGIGVGIAGSYLFGMLSGMRTVIVPYAIGISFTSAALVGILFGYLPARRAANLDPIVALRYE